jgi:molybdopterin cofactor biosynthesis moaC region|nr:MAG TPA: hypothetical protein [Caudoviricetes sp.]
MNQKDLETVLQAWINASLELAAVMEAQGMTRIAPVLQLTSGNDGELSLRIVTPEEEDEDWEMDDFWEDDEEGDA